MDKALALADVRRLRGAARGGAQRAASCAASASPTRSSRRPSPRPEFAEIRFDPSGNVDPADGHARTRARGTRPSSSRSLHERLGIDPDEVQYIEGDTDRVAFGIGTGGSRSTVIGGSALSIAADKIIAKGKKIAAHMLEAAEADIEFGDGALRDRRHRPRHAIDRCRDARRSSRRSCRPASKPGSYETGTFAAEPHLPERLPCLRGRDRSRDRRGRRSLATSWSTMSARSINPMCSEGQIHGGVAQGVGQALHGAASSTTAKRASC